MTAGLSIQKTSIQQASNTARLFKPSVSARFASTVALPQPASQATPSPIRKPIVYARIEDIRKELQENPILDSRSFTLEQVNGPRAFRESSFNRVTAPLLPKTGVRFIDQLNWKISDLLRLTKDSLFDFPKAALKGGTYGAIGGFIVGAVSNILFVNRRLDFWTGLVGCLGLIGGAGIGAGITLTRECFSKLGEIRKIAQS